MTGTSVAIIGAGIGGVAAALALNQRGIDVRLFEQADAFGRVGAAINVTPNAVQVLDGLGIGEDVRDVAARPNSRINRNLVSGEVISTLPLGSSAEERFGAPLLSLHRADLLEILERQLHQGQVNFGKRLTGLDCDGDEVEMVFADGGSERCDILVACDGVHSVARELIFPEQTSPSFTGIVAFRSLFPKRSNMEFDTENFTKWWGPNRETELVTFPSSRDEMFVFATLPQEQWTLESWTFEGDPQELYEGFTEFHPEARNVVAQCSQVLKTALLDREPLPRWTSGRVALLGDACHPMTPFMAQGAAMALEDAAVLARCLEAAEDAPAGLAAYETLRKGRASRIQINSHNNEWQGRQVDADWVYGHNVWNSPLAG